MILERINNGQDGVAEWFYDFFEAKLQGVNLESLETRLNCLNKILLILGEFDLFTPKKVVINHEKLKESVSIDVKNGKNTLDLRDYFDSNGIEFIEGTHLSIYGSSVIHLVNQHEVLDGVFVILYTGAGINLMTDSDAWLEYDLEGNDQKKSAAINAKRLKSALEEIEQQLGFEPVYDHSKYAYVHKYELKNYFEDDGTPQVMI